MEAAKAVFNYWTITGRKSDTFPYMTPYFQGHPAISFQLRRRSSHIDGFAIQTGGKRGLRGSPCLQIRRQNDRLFPVLNFVMHEE